MNPTVEDILLHYGVKRRSGRYPWGSGKNPYQHSQDFLARVETDFARGMTEKEIADAMDMSTTELRLQMKLAKHERRNLQAARVRSLRDDGLSLQEIAEQMGFKSDSSVRTLLDEGIANNKNKAYNTADRLKEELKTKGMIDVGAGAELELGVSSSTLKEALRILEIEGYEVYPLGQPQVTNPGKQTNMPVLCPPGTEWKEVYAARDAGKIESVGQYHSTDGGESFKKIQYPSSIDSKRVKIVYAEEGGLEKDGVIEIRRGVEDLSLGNSHYAQVRIMVDGTHYLKGMAMYTDGSNMPDGVDILFNTNKAVGTDKMDVLKRIKNDPDNPFGATIMANGQSYYDDPKGKFTDPLTGKKQSLCPINKLKEEGDWDSMSRNLSQQFLSKQPLPLIKKQLKLTYADAEAEYDEIMSLTNPTVKRHCLMEFADQCEGAAIHLKAAALPRQKTAVILPLSCMKETEVYAPNYDNGEKIALVRYPHAGTFELPILTVNNNVPEARKTLGIDITDAIGINAKVASRLSGADFDGDQVVTFPVGRGVNVVSTKALDDLKNFEAKIEYGLSSEGHKIISKMEAEGANEIDICKAVKKATGVTLLKKSMVQKQMGMISNLITDMTLRGATESELARAVKHSMVVIDANKHHLDYKRSERDNGIAELREIYQPKFDEEGNKIPGQGGGASTLLSRRKQTIDIPERKGSGRIDPETGKVIYKESGRKYVDKKGNLVEAKSNIPLVLAVDDVRSLSSGTLQEEAYVDYANKMKALANRTRIDILNTPRLEYKASAAKIYAEEVASLNAKLNLAAKNAPKERRAQNMAYSIVRAKKLDNPDMDKKELKKLRQQTLTRTRIEVGASGKESRIDITDKEWEAIQMGALSDSKVSRILRYADSEKVRERAMPRTTVQLSEAKIARISALSSSGYTNKEIANIMGISTSSVSKYLNR